MSEFPRKESITFFENILDTHNNVEEICKTI